ncbi:VWA domain-containing protein [Larsenimonas rhizosphaerae]|uniref:VWA domain-containing protein n=1 Tax=Larsenimonas rhizosphaerae TaxID=2944682 RepID=A0AA42CY28_9GAMM|nr:VWA domain-containing protein [Larsenimonas rhizosphaerae]MCX2524600.1 VWA domain-containing protein [Larsenimonas rhizosphaerae]
MNIRRDRRSPGTLTMVLLGMMLLLTGGPAAMADSTPGPPSVRLLVDVSGSMKANDPRNLRASGIRLWSALLPADARGGLWTFGSRVDNPVPMASADSAWRASVVDALPALTRYQQFTDIEQGLSRALQGARSGQGPVHVILLTDGMVDLPSPSTGDKTARDQASRDRLLNELVPEFVRRGIVVDTIALSDHTDQALLTTLSQQTGGLASVADTSAALTRSFLDVLSQVAPFQQVPLTQGRFRLDNRVDSVRALLFHEEGASPLRLVGPDGQQLTADAPGEALWQTSDRFDLVTLPSPMPGMWKVEGSLAPGSRIMIDSGLRLQVDTGTPTLYQYFPRPLDAWLESNGDTVRAGDVGVAPLSMRASLVSNQGKVLANTELESRDDNGHYQGRLDGVSQLGNARLRLLAEGEDLQRLRVKSVNVVPALSASLDAREGVIRVQAVKADLNHDTARVMASLQGEPLTVTPAAPREWRVTLPADIPPQTVPVHLQATVDIGNAQRTIDLPDVLLNPDADSALNDAQSRGDITASDMPERAPEADAGTPDNLQGWLALAGQKWQTLAPVLKHYAAMPWVWAVAAAALLLLLWRRAAVNRRRRTQRREPHLGSDEDS